MKTIITLTTIPTRLNSTTYTSGIKDCLNSLLNQEFDGDYEIHLNIPDENHKTKEKYIVPDWLKNLSITNPKLKLFCGLQDLGTITKIFYTLHREDNPNTIIVVCDDDLIYHPSMLSEHVKNQSIYENTAIGYDGTRADRETAEDVSKLKGDVRDHYVVSVAENIYVNVLQHYKTVSYKRNFFKDDFFEFYKEGSWNDDIIVAAYLGKHNIRKMVTFYENEEKLLSLQDWRDKGGVTTFPVLSHTAHDRNEGCNLYRQEQADDSHTNFYKMGYLK